MRQVNRIDTTTGMYIEPVILQDDENCPMDCIETPCPQPIYLPRWNGSAWVEGKTAEEIAVVQASVIVEKSTDERISELETLVLQIGGII